MEIPSGEIEFCKNIQYGFDSSPYIDSQFSSTMQFHCEIHEAQCALRFDVLENSGAISYPPARDLAAHLLVYLDDARVCWQIATRWLLDKLGAARVDGGWGNPDAPLYAPGQNETLCASEYVSTLKGVMVENSEPGVMAVWQSKKPVIFRELSSEAGFSADLRKALVQRGTSTKIAVSLHSDAGPFAIIGADRFEEEREWDTLDYEILSCVSSQVLAPVLRTAFDLERRVAAGAVLRTIPHLSNAEYQVALLTSQGLSYKEIARSLRKSPFTIDHQLRSIRGKLGVVSHAKLVSRLAHLSAQGILEQCRPNCPPPGGAADPAA